MEIAQVTALMEQKKKALREFQAVTQKMLECSRDDLKKLVEKRDHLIREMDRAEAEIQAQLTDLEEADPVRQAVAGTLEGTGHGEESRSTVPAVQGDPCPARTDPGGRYPGFPAAAGGAGTDPRSDPHCQSGRQGQGSPVLFGGSSPEPGRFPSGKCVKYFGF